MLEFALPYTALGWPVVWIGTATTSGTMKIPPTSFFVATPATPRPKAIGTEAEP
jgi:hypothetical protein